MLKHKHDEWELPGGRIEPYETPEECVAREVLEETQLRITTGPILDSWIYYVNDVEKHVFIVTYGCYLDSAAEPVVSHEHQEVGLFGAHEIAGLNMPDGFKRSIMAWFAQQRTAGNAQAKRV